MPRIHCAVAALCAALASSAPAAGAPRAVPIADFEAGIAGWQTNDAGKATRATPEATLVSIAAAGGAHSGSRCLEVRFHPGEGWANAWLPAAQAGELWAAAGADTLRLWMRGDGSDHEVRIGLQAWTDDLKPVMFQAPVSLRETTWHEVRIPLSRLQASEPRHALRLMALISLQIDASGDIGPARLWIDDIAAVRLRGDGARFATGPFDARIAALPPARELPRLGNWSWPGLDWSKADACRRLGIGFSSNYDATLPQQRAFLAGIVTNSCPGRPSGPEMIAGLGLTDADMDQDAQGNHTGEGIESAMFHPTVVERFCRYVAERTRARARAPWIASFMLSSPISMYGEAHYPQSTAGQFAVFSRPAKAGFQRWLRRAYRDDLAALSRAWGTPLARWEDALPPAGPADDGSGIDRRRRWSDFMHWYSGWLDDVTARSLRAARAQTGKPLAVMLGGPKIGLSQGIAQGNIGPVARILAKVRPAFLSDTDGETLFSCRYSRAACAQYGIELMVEHIGPPYLQVHHQYATALNALACGADRVHLAHVGELFDPNHWFSRVWTHLAPLVLRHRTAYVPSEAAIFHSYVTSWYRPDRSNGDAVALYETINTLWFPERGYPSWGRALGSPDVVDDAMVEDGGLAGRKLLVVPNSSVTLTTRRAVAAIGAWVRGGGTLVGFGPGCLAYTVGADRRVTPTPGLAGLLGMGAEAVRAAAAADPLRPLEARLGKGRVVLYPLPADTSLVTPSGGPWVRAAVPELRAAAARAGVRVWCRADDADDANLMYAGRDRETGRHLFVADLTRCVRNGLPDAIFWTDRAFTPTFNSSLSGDAELLTITDSFESCEGGEANYDPEAHTLSVRFRLPGKLTLRFGKGRSGLALARHPLLLWERGELVLRPVGGYGTPQTQGPLTVGADGTLTPEAASVPYLIHGDLHRAKFGRGPTFRLTLARPGAVAVRVDSVPSGAPGGAELVAWLDGREVLRRALPDRDGKQDPFAGEYGEEIGVEVPAGTHEVRFDNVGADWVSVGRYVFRGLGGG
ncbi:MAG: hypothetical protein IT208_00025 [Chthonomonadales bacterium]|nr:hypothetical protein [Chthonomonadales bacterium]